MNLDDITVEVRDKNLTRLGVIQPQDMDFDCQNIFTNTGTWRLTLPSEHPLAAELRSPGAGIVCTDADGLEFFSGPTVKPELQQTPEDLLGSVTVEGISDDHVLADALAYPDPAVGDATAQTKARDERTGTAESLLHQFVSANIGPTAPANRRKAILDMGANGNRGATIAKGARFPVLGLLLTEIVAGQDLGFRVIQRGDRLVFETFAVTDRTGEIRLDVRNGGLSSQRVATSPPGATRVIVAGQNEGVDRQFLTADTPASIAAENAWGRRIERFVDQRQTDNWDELQQAADEVLAEEGLSGITIQVVPTDDSPMRFGRDWFLGDRVTVVVDDQELTAIATGMALKVDQEGSRFGVLVGDPTGYNTDALIRKRIVKTEQRLSALERVEPKAATPEGGQSMNFSFATAVETWDLPHNFNQQFVRIQCFDNNGAEVIGDPEYINANNARVTWFYPTAGSARVSTA